MLGLVIFTFNAIFVIFSVGLFLLPAIPVIRLACPDFRATPVRAAVEVLLGCPPWWWPWQSLLLKERGRRPGSMPAGLRQLAC